MNKSAITALIFILLTVPVGVHAATAQDLMAQIAALQAKIAALQGNTAATAATIEDTPRIRNLRVSAPKENGSWLRTVRVKGLPRAVFEDLKLDQQYRYQARFYLISNDGKLYDLGDGSLDQGSTARKVEFLVPFTRMNPMLAASEREFPAGRYTLKMELYKNVQGTPSYILDKKVIKTTESRKFSLP